MFNFKGGILIMGIHYKFADTGNQQIDDVGRQLEKIMKNCNQGSKETRYRNAAAMARFIKWVVGEFRLQKISNISDKHIIKYGKHLIHLGKSHKYIKDDLSGIRFVLRHTPNLRYELGDSQKVNQQIGIGSTPNGIADRKWTQQEFLAMVTKAHETGNEKIALMMEFSLRFGARLDEASSIRRNEIEYAIRNGIMKFTNTKGGRIRYIPIKKEDITFLKECIKNVKRGNYVFCPVDKQVHQHEKYVQGFIRIYRGEIQDYDRTQTAHGVGDNQRGALSYHGLRHSYSDNEYKLLLKEMEQEQAVRKEIAERLGHGRIAITRTYLGF